MKLKYFLIAPLFCLLILQLTPKNFGKNVLAAGGVFDAVSESFNAILNTITGKTVADITPTDEKEIQAVLDKINLNNYTPEQAKTALDAFVQGINIKGLPNNAVGIGIKTAIETAYKTFALPVTLPIALTEVADETVTTLEKIDLTRLQLGTSTYKAIIKIPCDAKIGGSICQTSQNTPAGYISHLYIFGLMIVGLVAFGAIIYGAVLYTLSAGNIGSKDEAKDQMLQAVLGLLLLMGAYLILYTINPTLVSLSNPTLEIPAVSQEQYSSTARTNTPSENPGTQIDGCAEMSGGLWSIFNDFATVDVNRQEVLSTGDVSSSKCTKCMAGNDEPDAEGKCYCQTDLTRRFNGMCCKSTEAVYNGACTSCSHFTLNFSDSDISALSNNELSDINESCGINLCGTGKVSFYGVCRACDQSLKTDIAQSILSTTEKIKIYTKCGF